MATPLSDVLQPTDPPSTYPAPVSYVQRMAAWLRSILYTKPSTGIPETDLASDVQTKLNRDIWVHEPDEEGTNGQVLTTDGEGGRTWADAGSVGPSEYLKKAEVNSTNKTLEIESVGGTSLSMGIAALGGVTETALGTQMKAKADGVSLYPEYSQKTYAKDDVVFREGRLYKCKDAISTAEEWTAEHWDETTIGELKANSATSVQKSSSIPALGDDPTEDEVIAALKAIRTLCAAS